MKRLDHPVAAEELLRMPDRGVRRELVRGEVREMAPPGGEHGIITNRLNVRLASFVWERRLGEVTAAETGFVLERGPDTVRAPDIAFIARERLPEPLPKGFFELAPDLVAEIRSPGDSRRDLDEKVSQWLASGVRAVWVLDPDRRTVAVHRPGEPARVLEEDDALEGEDVVPGFRCPLAEVFG